MLREKHKNQAATVCVRVNRHGSQLALVEVYAPLSIMDDLNHTLHILAKLLANHGNTLKYTFNYHQSRQTYTVSCVHLS